MSKFTHAHTEATNRMLKSKRFGVVLNNDINHLVSKREYIVERDGFKICTSKPLDLIRKGETK